MRFDITFSESDQYAIIRLKQSITDINQAEVEIILIVTNNKISLITTLHILFI